MDWKLNLQIQSFCEFQLPSFGRGGSVDATYTRSSKPPKEDEERTVLFQTLAFIKPYGEWIPL